MPYVLHYRRKTIQETLLLCSPLTKWIQFWSLNTSPEARTLCYHFLYDKLYCQDSVSRFAPDVSAACRLCQAPLEDINHPLITCPFKWPIWQEVPFQFVPHLEFFPDDVHAILQNLSRFQFVNNNFLLILSTCVLLVIWRVHWRTIFDRKPFSSGHIMTTIFDKSTPLITTSVFLLNHFI